MSGWCQCSALQNSSSNYVNNLPRYSRRLASWRVCLQVTISLETSIHNTGNLPHNHILFCLSRMVNSHMRKCQSNDELMMTWLTNGMMSCDKSPNLLCVCIIHTPCFNVPTSLKVQFLRQSYNCLSGLSLLIHQDTNGYACTVYTTIVFIVASQ